MKNQKISHADGVEYFMSSIKFDCSLPKQKNNSYHFIATKESIDQKIRVAIRNETDKTTPSSHFKFNPNDEYDWLALVFNFENEKQSWIIPKDIAIKHTTASKKGAIHIKKISLSYKTLKENHFKIFENNWLLNK